MQVDRSLVVSLDRKLPDVCQTAATVAPPLTPGGGKKKQPVEVSISSSASKTDPDAHVVVDKPPQDNTVETEDQFNTKVFLLPTSGGS